MIIDSGFSGLYDFLALHVQELTEDAEIANVRFTKSVISSKASFEYSEAQMRLDDT